MTVKNRWLSFGIVFLVYLSATILGYYLYKELPYGFELNLLIADVAMTAYVFIFSLIFKNASVYDPYWSVQPIIILAFFATGTSVTPLGWLLIIAVGLWAIRLTANWAYTFHGLQHQDWRYTMLHEKTGVFYPIINFVGIHLVPTLVVYGCTLPAVYALVYSAESNVLSVICVGLSCLAFTVQGIADIQMHKFKKQKKSGFIRTGLWKHSRHPNYLGEILMWWGVALASCCAMPDRWYLIAGAVANTILFFSVSIPMADGKMSKREGFQEYKSHTRMLLPIKR